MLHNFCIDETQMDVPQPTTGDVASIALEGGILYLEIDAEDQVFPDNANHLNSLLNGKHHF